MLLLLGFALFSFVLSLSNQTTQIGPGFWNVRASFKVSGFEIGTQMSFVQLKSGRFLIVDTVEMNNDLLSDISTLTNNGTLIEAVIATHPFHTVYFPPFYQLFPKIPFYGTPRHLRIQPEIPWAGSLWDCNTRQKWLPEVHMRIPRGGEFVAPVPESSNHFSAIHLFHEASKTIHVDDTITYDVPFSGNMFFSPYNSNQWTLCYTRITFCVSRLGPKIYSRMEFHQYLCSTQRSRSEWS